MESFIGIFKNVLKEVEDFEIEIINFGKINVVENLKKIKRSGKKIRLEKLKCSKIKIRTVYDHVNSLAQTAKVLIDNNIINCNYEMLATMIVCHDLLEVLITDCPSYTSNFSIKSKSITNVLDVDKKVREEYATNFLWLYANKEQKKAIETLKEENEEQDIFRILDKIDPIINVWRYMYVYRNRIKNTKKDYIKIMEDFFTYPVLNRIVETNTYPIISEIIAYLKDTDNARAYLEKGTISKEKLSETALKIVLQLVEETPLFYK